MYMYTWERGDRKQDKLWSVSFQDMNLQAFLPSVCGLSALAHRDKQQIGDEDQRDPPTLRWTACQGLRATLLLQIHPRPNSYALLCRPCYFYTAQQRVS